jgi:ubiquinone/menaquinone biosynthesis C-methylase UbiE
MSVQRSYDAWASMYDSNINPTRDLESSALQQTLKDRRFNHCLEIGCGTGKNTAWLEARADSVTAVDNSTQMLDRAREKISSDKVTFIQADILAPWNFADKTYDLVSFSLVLEHIEDLDSIFEKVSKVMTPGGMIYIGELHPFKQYAGTKARFETEAGTDILTSYTHHISDFTTAAAKHGFLLQSIGEYFDTDDRKGIPKILTLLFQYAQV